MAYFSAASNNGRQSPNLLIQNPRRETLLRKRKELLPHTEPQLHQGGFEFLEDDASWQGFTI